MRFDKVMARRLKEQLRGKINANGVRLGVLCVLIGVTSMAAILSSCKSRYGFTNQNKQGAETNPDSRSSDGTTASTTGTSNGATTGADTGSAPDGTSGENNGNSTGGTTSSSSESTTGGSAPDAPTPTSPGGPIAGIEAWQDGLLVSSIATGKMVYFKLTKCTRDTSATSGCEDNVGIVQSSWTIGSRPQVDIQRFAGQDCRSFDYSGTFTKPGTIGVMLDVLTGDGESAHAEATYAVTGAVVADPASPSTMPSGTPTQK